MVISARGKRVTMPAFSLQVLPKPDTHAVPDYGLTASRKVGNAVIRNRVRRRLRALVQADLKQYAKAGYDYVLVLRTAALTRAFADLRHDLHAALKRLDCWQS